MSRKDVVKIVLWKTSASQRERRGLLRAQPKEDNSQEKGTRIFQVFKLDEDHERSSWKWFLPLTRTQKFNRIFLFENKPAQTIDLCVSFLDHF